jgi:hypothetical protein
MAICKVAGCNKETSINPKTGHYNMLCFKHFKEQQNTSTPNRGQGRKQGLGRGAAPKKSPKSTIQPKVKKSSLFVLRGNTLTINYSHTVRHIPVNMYTRVVKYNEDSVGASGNHFKYIIDIKQGSESIIRVLIDTKKERDIEFDRLQQLLSTL